MENRDTTRPVIAGGVGLTGVVGLAAGVVVVALGVRLGTVEGVTVGDTAEVVDCGGGVAVGAGVDLTPADEVAADAGAADVGDSGVGGPPQPLTTTTAATRPTTAARRDFTRPAWRS